MGPEVIASRVVYKNVIVIQNTTPLFFCLWRSSNPPKHRCTQQTLAIATRWNQILATFCFILFIEKFITPLTFSEFMLHLVTIEMGWKVLYCLRVFWTGRNWIRGKFLIKSSPALEDLLVSDLAELILLYLFNDFNFNFYVFVLVVTKN